MDTLDTLLSRASSSRLGLPIPDAPAIAQILAAALRAPDHGRLIPWRFLVVQGEGLARLAEAGAAALRRRDPAAAEAELDRAREKLTRAPLVIVLGGRMIVGHKIPVFEQQLAIAAGAMNVLNALHATGFAGKWVTGPNVDDAAFAQALGFGEDEQLFGMIMAGTPDRIEAPARPEVAPLARFWQ